MFVVKLSTLILPFKWKAMGKAQKGGWVGPLRKVSKNYSFLLLYGFSGHTDRSVKFSGPSMVIVSVFHCTHIGMAICCAKGAPERLLGLNIDFIMRLLFKSDLYFRAAASSAWTVPLFSAITYNWIELQK